MLRCLFLFYPRLRYSCLCTFKRFCSLWWDHIALLQEKKSSAVI